MPEIVPLAKARAHLSELVERVGAEHERFLITRYGMPVAVLLSPDELESLEETIDILRDRKLLESIRRSRAEAAVGKRLKLGDFG